MQALRETRLPALLRPSLLLIALATAATGCVQRMPEVPAPPPLKVEVSKPLEKEVTDYADFTGRLTAVESVEVRARVWGYLDKINFKEGALVKKGDVLFEIDPRSYQAAVAQAEGNVSAMQAKLKRLDSDFQRAERLLSTRVLSREEYEKTAGDRAEAAASLEALKAAVQQTKLDLGFTKIIAPVDGRVSRALVTVGNLISSGQTGGTLLTTIVSVDPIYVYFDVDERTVQHIRRLIREGKAKSAREAPLKVWIGLASDVGMPHEGVIDFVDNQTNPKTGTLRVRGVFDNKNDILSPGYFARVRIPIGLPHKSLLITDRAVDTDQGRKILYVVDKANKVVVRSITLGARHDGLRAIEQGLERDDRVIVNGLQLVRPDAVVDPQLVAMPVSRNGE